MEDAQGVTVPLSEISLSYYTNTLKRHLALLGLLQHQELIESE